MTRPTSWTENNHRGTQELQRKFEFKYDDYSPVCYFTLNERAEIIDLNLTGARLLGHEKSALKGLALGAWIDRDHKQNFADFFQNILASTVLLPSMLEVKLLFNEAIEPLPMQIHAITIENFETGPEVRLALIDISHKHHSEELDRTNKRLQREKIVRENFVSTLVHDLRTPLNSVKLSSQILANNSLSEEKRIRLLTLLVEGVDRADRMIKDLLDYNRLEAGKELPITMRYCHLNQLVFNCLSDLRSIQPETLQLDLVTSKEIFGFWSHDSLLRILENLVLNAIKYGDQKRPITVYLEESESRARIRVHNFGNPIALEDQRGLFHAFSRTQSAQDGSQKGWGLGLSLVAELTTRHKGSCYLASDEKQGTSFTIDLPLDPRSAVTIPRELH